MKKSKHFLVTLLTLSFFLSLLISMHSEAAAKNLKDNESITFQTADPSILNCSMKIPENNKCILEFFPITDGENDYVKHFKRLPDQVQNRDEGCECF